MQHGLFQIAKTGPRIATMYEQVCKFEVLYIRSGDAQ